MEEGFSRCVDTFWMDLNRNPISQFDLCKKDPNSSINMEKGFQEVQFLLKSKLNQAIDIQIQFGKDDFWIYRRDISLKEFAKQQIYCLFHQSMEMVNLTFCH